MAMPIRDITNLIPKYDGKEKLLDSFIKKIDRLWTYVTKLEETDREQFLLVLQIRLKGRASEAVQENAFEDWEVVKIDLINKITSYRSTEKSELKLGAIRQKHRETVEAYAKRIEKALETLNRSFAQKDQNKTIRKENDRKARKTFENGLIEPVLQDKAISRGSSTFKEAVDYVIEQELRYAELELLQNYRPYCKTPEHNFFQFQGQERSNKNEVSYQQRHHVNTYTVPTSVPNNHSNRNANFFSHSHCYSLRKDAKQEIPPEHVKSKNNCRNELSTARATYQRHILQAEVPDLHSHYSNVEVPLIDEYPDMAVTANLDTCKQANLKFIIDTRARYSIIKYSDIRKGTIDTKDDSKIYGLIRDQHVTTIGKMSANIALDEVLLKHTFFIIQEEIYVPYNGILGADFLSKFNAEIQYSKLKNL